MRKSQKGGKYSLIQSVHSKLTVSWRCSAEEQQGQKEGKLLLEEWILALHCYTGNKSDTHMISVCMCVYDDANWSSTVVCTGVFVCICVCHLHHSNTLQVLVEAFREPHHWCVIILETQTHTTGETNPQKMNWTELNIKSTQHHFSLNHSKICAFFLRDLWTGTAWQSQILHVFVPVTVPAQISFSYSTKPAVCCNSGDVQSVCGEPGSYCACRRSSRVTDRYRDATHGPLIWPVL